MTLRTTESPLRTIRRLWQRAPLWRFSAMSALVLSLLFVLFFPNRIHSPPVTSNRLGEASYHSLPHPASPPSADLAASTRNPVNATAASSRDQPAAPVAPVTTGNRPGRIKTASLSLATPGGASSTAGNSGLNIAMAGRSYHGTFPANGFNVPLPSGDWLLLANFSIKMPHAAGEVLYLGKIERLTLTGVVRITAVRSTDQSGTGFPEAKGCTSEAANNNFTLNEQVVASGHQACWLIQNYFTNPMQRWADRGLKIPPLERAAAGDLAAKGVSYPQDMMMVRFTRAETWGLLEVGYIFSPEAEHISSGAAATYSDSEWHLENIKRFPEKEAYVEKLKRWAEGFWPRFKTAFDTTLPSADR